MLFSLNILGGGYWGWYYFLYFFEDDEDDFFEDDEGCLFIFIFFVLVFVFPFALRDSPELNDGGYCGDGYCGDGGVFGLIRRLDVFCFWDFGSGGVGAMSSGVWDENSFSSRGLPDGVLGDTNGESGNSGVTGRL